MKKKLVTEIISFLLVLLFTYAATSKFLDRRIFVFQMDLSPFPPVKASAEWLSWLVPGVEGVVACLLLFGKTRKYGLFASLALLLVFEIYIATLLLSGWNLPCTCGGIISRLSWKGHLWFNAAFILLAAIGCLDRGRHTDQRDNRSALLQI